MILPQPLEYNLCDLAPHIEHDCAREHFDRFTLHHVDFLNNMMLDTVIDGFGLEQAIRVVSQGTSNHALLHQLCSVWNHNFFWSSIAPAQIIPVNDVTQEIIRQFGSMEAFTDKVVTSGASQFGSSWTWLMLSNGKLNIRSYPGSICPFIHTTGVPLFVIDGWEHAYINQYGADKAAYFKSIMNLINWERINDRYNGAR